MAEMTSPWLTRQGAAVYAGCSPRTLSRAVAAGTLRAVRLAGNLRLRFRAEWIDTWLLEGRAPEGPSDVRHPAINQNAPASDRFDGNGRANVKVL